MGLKKIASNLYMSEYNRSLDINYVAKACNIDLEISDYMSYIEDYSLMQQNERYADYINYLNRTNYNSNIDVLTKSSLIDEDNYYKCKLVKALFLCNETNQAVTIVKENLQANIGKNINYLQPDNYYMSTMLTCVKSYTYFVDGGDNSILGLLCTYYNNLESYRSILEEQSGIDNIYLVNFYRRILLVGSNILEIDINIENDVISDEIKDTITNVITDINNKISELI
ncbi:MAG: hypothetical protein E7361_00950 [Clostridiales bacterium]|nr:hypothetical protein [Clostridiales bacterium]